MKPKLFVSASALGVTEVGVGKKTSGSRHRGESERSKHWRELAQKELRAYFAGRTRRFSTPCDIRALPPFTQAVLRMTAQIPYGHVRSYEWVARRVGKPGAARAVGNALGRNPLPIIIPCHRIVRTDGTIGGFALGTGWKKKLLALEKSLVKSPISRKKKLNLSSHPLSGF